MARRYYDDPNRCDLKPPCPVEPEFASRSGDAERDGYTVSARRARHDAPGRIVPLDEAESLERMQAEYEKMQDEYPYYPDW
jgi:hypothetical protein